MARHPRVRGAALPKASLPRRAQVCLQRSFALSIAKRSRCWRTLRRAFLSDRTGRGYQQGPQPPRWRVILIGTKNDFFRGLFRDFLRRSGTFSLFSFSGHARWPLRETVTFQWFKWSEWRDSNPRPLVPQTSALTGLRYTPTALVIGTVAAARNVALQRSASRRRRAGMRKDSLRLHNFGQRFAQRRKLVVRDPGMGVWRAGFFLSPGGRLSGVSGLLGRSNGR
jgi:hypothetical protein